MLTLVLGGARSGKSAFAEEFAVNTERSLVYLATATIGDQEMADRIGHHQNNRSKLWSLVEEPLYLVDALEQHCNSGTCVLVDCLTLWLTNLLLNENPALLTQEQNRLLACASSLPGDIVFVSNEVGMGLIAADPVSRQFVDESGRLHQSLAKSCDNVFFVTAGLPTALKTHGA